MLEKGKHIAHITFVQEDTGDASEAVEGEEATPEVIGEDAAAPAEKSSEGDSE